MRGVGLVAAEVDPADRRWTFAQLFLVWVLAVASLGPAATNIGPTSWTYPVLGISLLVGVAMMFRGPRVHRLGSAAGLWIAFFGYSALTVMWSTTPRPDMALAVIALAALVMIVPWVAMSDSRCAGVTRSSLLLACCSAVAAGSGLHFLALVALGEHTPFVDRLALPIGGASTSGVALTLCLAVLGEDAIKRQPTQLHSRALAIATMVLVSQTGSRSAVLMAGGVVLIAALRSSFNRAVALSVAAVSSMMLFGSVWLARGHVGLTDDARTLTLLRALSSWNDSWTDVVFGAGAGEIWPWLAIETGSVPRLGKSLQWESPYGGVLYHPHSVPLGVLVESGLLGAAIFTAGVVALVWQSMVTLRSQTGLLIVAAALAVVVPALFVEYLMFRNFPGSLLLWACVWSLATPSHDPPRVVAGGQSGLVMMALMTGNKKGRNDAE